MVIAGKFEALKYSLRQSKDGVVISLVVHPSDVSPELMALPIGARVEIEWSECTDEEPASNREMPPDVSGGAREAVPVLPRAAEDSGRLPKERKRFSELPLSQQAGMRCGELAFARFVAAKYGASLSRNDGDIVKTVHDICGIKSRAGLIIGTTAGSWWQIIETDYRNWLAQEQHGALVR